MKLPHIALLLALLIPVADSVTAQTRSPAPSSYRGGFSSQRAAPTSVNRPPPPKPSPSFGSFGSRATPQPMPAPRKSESVLSQRLAKGQAEANAARTLEVRRSAQQAASAPPVLVPGAGQYQHNGGYRERHSPMPGPIVIPHRTSGYGGAVATGAIVGTAAGSHANAAPVHQERSAGSGFMSTFIWLLVLATIGWLMYFGWQRLRRGKAPRNANYSFERD